MAAVVSEPRVAAMYTPSSQVAASVTSGTVEERRPPKMNAEIGTPVRVVPRRVDRRALRGGHGEARVRVRGRAARSPGVHSLPVQSVSFAGGSFVMPSHHTSPSGVSATLVKMVLALMVSMQFGLVS